MPKVFRAPNPHSLVHRAIEKAGGIKRLSECVHLSPRTVAQWVKVDRISNKHILQVCHAADVEPLPLLAYIERKKKPWFFKVAARKENALATLTRLQQGEISLAEAATTLNLSPRQISLITTKWGDRLPLLKETLESDLPQAVKAARLNVTERQLRRLQTTYLPPRPDTGPKPYRIARERAKSKWRLYHSQAVKIVRGELSVVAAAEEIGLSKRQMHRWLEKTLTDRFGLQLQSIRPLPRPFRYALAVEVEQEHPAAAVHLINYWRRNALKTRVFGKVPDSWKRVSLRRCLIGLFNGEISLKELAEARETDSGRLVPLLTSNLIPFGVTFEAAASWSVFHQAALAEILNALPEPKTPIFRPGEAIKSGFQPKFSLKKAAK